MVIEESVFAAPSFRCCDGRVLAVLAAAIGQRTKHAMAASWPAMLSGQRPRRRNPRDNVPARSTRTDVRLDLPNETLGLLPQLRRDHEIRMRLRDV
jgi:hypothetical protein